MTYYFVLCRWAPAAVVKSMWADSVWQFYRGTWVICDVDGQRGAVIGIRGICSWWAGSHATPVVPIFGKIHVTFSHLFI